MKCISLPLTEFKLIEDYNSEADLFEIRLDLNYSLEAFTELKQYLTVTDITDRTIITCRRPEDGGEWPGSENERIELLREMSSLGVKYIDIEYGLDPDIYTDKDLRKSEIILSHHNIQETGNIENIAVNMLEIPASVYKVAVKVNSYSDNLKIIDIGNSLSQKGINAACFGMGEKSEYSRIMIQKNRFSLHYLSAGKNRTAPGQLSVEYGRMLDFKRINESTEVYGIIGNPVEHSLSPLIHNTIFSSTGYNGVYIRFSVDDLPDFLNFMKKADLKGLSVTYPLKSIEHYRYPDFQTAKNTMFDSINTIYKRGDFYYLADTDYDGFAGFFRNHAKLKPCKVLILGSGNTSFKIATFLNKEGFSVETATRDIRKSTEPGYTGYEEIKGKKYSLVINTTPWNSNVMEHLDSVFASSGQGVFIDLNYNYTTLDTVNLARDYSWEALDGTGMLIEQALLQSKLWTGLKISEELFTGLNDIIRKIIL